MKQIIQFLLLGFFASSGFAAEVLPHDLARQIIVGFNSGQRVAVMQATNVSILQKAAKDYPDDSSIHYALGICYMAQTNGAASVASMEKAYATSKKDPQIGLMYGLVLKMNKESLKAYKLDKEIAAARPEIPQLQVSLATLEMTIQKYDEATAILESLQNKAPPNLTPADKGILLMMLGTCYLHKGDHAEAIKTLEDANSLTPNAAVLLVTMGEAYLKAGQLEKGREFLDKALAINPRIPSALFYKGICFESSGSPNLAKGCYQNSYTFGKERLGDNGEDYYLMAQVCRKLSKEVEAEHYSRQAAELLYTSEAPWKQQ